MTVVDGAPRPPRGAAHAPGEVLASKYKLEQLAGEGAMGEVWLATHLVLDMPVALKLLRKSARTRRDGRPTLARGGESQLLREAQAIARFTHPNIVRVHDFGLSEAGDPFIVMERLEGEDLRDRLQRSARIEVVEAVGLALLVIHAMHTAHARGVVHRDLKPENIFLTADDEGRVVPKVVDFGIADLEWETDAKPALAGTPAYMAPEQLALGVADHRVDIWAICVVLYEMISGRTPAAARAARDVPTRASGATEMVCDPPALGVEDGVDAALWSILAGGLRSATERFATMRELGEALARWLMARGVHEGLDGVSLAAKWLDEPSRSDRPPALGVAVAKARSSSSETPGQLVSRTTGRVVTHVRERSRDRRFFASIVVGAALAIGASGWAIRASVVRGEEVGPGAERAPAAVLERATSTAASVDVASSWTAEPVRPASSSRAASSGAPIASARTADVSTPRRAAPPPRPYSLPPRAPSASASASLPAPSPSAVASAAPAASTTPRAEDLPYLDGVPGETVSPRRGF